MVDLLKEPAYANAFLKAVELILQCQGHVIVAGIGKSGHIARKIAATLASTGTPAFFVHAAEAVHGDLGMIAPQDVVIMLSNSGQAQELLTILPVLKRQGSKVISMTGNHDSEMARHADVHIFAGAQQEACPLNLAPTASTTAHLAMGDALAVALLNARGFSAQDFARSHPGGALGRRLLTYVRDVMRTGEQIPQVSDTATLSAALLEMTRKRLGMTAIVNAQQQVVGIFTDGDLRRMLERTLDFSGLSLAEVMTANPVTIQPDRMAVDAVTLMETRRITQLLVTDEQHHLVGALNMHDLFAAKIV
ncbi:KpsF/GutQ family sugar-phosphate isomerase [Ampullimonas aquatilis]|uniref:KpsF/GutQ family sugar-phosphate isomerase n=1 Tax=Ampullimonas aquatilis TaxID=1341549 RepID=UPI003C78C1CA